PLPTCSIYSSPTITSINSLSLHDALPILPQTELQQSGFDVVTCNPPYFKTPNDNEKNKNEHLTIARHEVCCTLEDVIKACKLYVRPGGKVALVHRPGRLVDI